MTAQPTLGEMLGRIAARFVAEVQRPLGLVAKYNNDPPCSADGLVTTMPDPASGLTWVSVRVMPDSPTRPELGPGAMTQYRGAVVVDILSPSEAGLAESDRVVAAVIALQQAAVERVHYRTAELIEPGRTAAGAWWMVQVAIPFRFSLR